MLINYIMWSSNLLLFFFFWGGVCIQLFPMFFIVQVFQSPGFSGSRFSRVHVQGPGPGFGSSRKWMHIKYVFCETLSYEVFLLKKIICMVIKMTTFFSMIIVVPPLAASYGLNNITVRWQEWREIKTNIFFGKCVIDYVEPFSIKVCKWNQKVK